MKPIALYYSWDVLYNYKLVPINFVAHRESQAKQDFPSCSSNVVFLTFASPLIALPCARVPDYLDYHDYPNFRLTLFLLKIRLSSEYAPAPLNISTPESASTRR